MVLKLREGLSIGIFRILGKEERRFVSYSARGEMAFKEKDIVYRRGF